MHKFQTLFWSVIFNILSLLFFLFPLNRNRVIFNSAENKNFNYNSRYLFEFLKNYNNEYEIYFVINDADLRAKLSIEHGGKYFITTYSLKSCFLIMRSKFWIISTFESPYVCFVRHHRRIVFHLGHGIPLKAIGQLAKFPTKLKLKLQKILRIRPITHALCYSEEYKTNMSAIFNSDFIEYVPLGQPRNDSIVLKDSVETGKLIKESILNVPSFDKAILYSPTWRPYDKARFFPFADLEANELNSILSQTKTMLFLRGHPFFESFCPDSFENLSNIHWLNNDVIDDITSHLPFFDKIITDYSSIFIDYLCVNKPIGFLQYDYQQYDDMVGFATDDREIFCGVKIESSDDFISFIIDQDDSWMPERLKIARLLNIKNSGNSLENKMFLDSLRKK
ncbi:CDP-glycerol glycerophosphotransferase family protein [Escherichia coli]|uniref:CDP-glycerol glycerophosphotransferase family protein n=1 Tax=Escherichia coli TaxID=562 RepID=UPI0021C14B4B|nr:CDP-glycerol glycerophosphotransferase family protein [Escherichia coli]MCT9566325.1 CDP-glycerol glycerophosphotransferase family protein [Escherichia coli]MCT9608752.1 CDP-glycerol glycerophosphotransferase family protein [Escherichia coli]HBN2761330.1 CDP-glycerol glycerophosphotransferase family protein [Escherichia coli]